MADRATNIPINASALEDNPLLREAIARVERGERVVFRRGKTALASLGPTDNVIEKWLNGPRPTMTRKEIVALVRAGRR